MKTEFTAMIEVITIITAHHYIRDLPAAIISIRIQRLPLQRAS